MLRYYIRVTDPRNRLPVESFDFIADSKLSACKALRALVGLDLGRVKAIVDAVSPNVAAIEVQDPFFGNPIRGATFTVPLTRRVKIDLMQLPEAPGTILNLSSECFVFVWCEEGEEE